MRPGPHTRPTGPSAGWHPAPPGPPAGSSDLQLLQVSADRADRRDGVRWLVVLHKVVLNARLGAVGEDLIEVDRPGAHVHHAMLRTAGRVLHVNGWESSGPAREICQWILPALRDPVEIHLHLHELGIGLGEQAVVRKLTRDRREFEVV